MIKTLDRTAAPAFRTIEGIPVPQVKRGKLDNGIDLFTISAGSQEVTRVEFIFSAGMYHQPRPLVASCTNSMLESGTRSYTAAQIGEGIDFYGSFLELAADQDYATVTVYALNKYLEQTLAYVQEVIMHPVFPDQEFTLLLDTKRQKHAINSQKVNVLAKRKFVELLFGNKHPYGVNVTPEDFDTLRKADLEAFYNRCYTSSNCTVIAAGRLPADIGGILNRIFGGKKWGSGLAEPVSPAKPASAAPGLHFSERSDSIQSAVRVGRVLFNKRHEDYFAFQVLNTVLGGYFGSRLMANIREDKGYTYGIGSGITNLVNSGYFFISTEIGSEFTGPTLEEIFKEISRLQRDLIPDAELETVRNYMLGNFLRSVDGPFSLADKFRAIWEYGLDYDFYARYFDVVKSVRPAQLRELANRYLRRDDFVECVVGRMA